MAAAGDVTNTPQLRRATATGRRPNITMAPSSPCRLRHRTRYLRPDQRWRSMHHIPKDDAWKQAHLAMLVRLGKRAWLHCDDCRHSVMIEPHELARGISSTC